MSKRRVVVTGLGMLTPLGNTVDATWKAILSSQSGVGAITRFDASVMNTRIAAEVKNFEPKDFMLPEVFRKTDRFAQMGVAAARLAIDDAGIEGIINKKMASSIVCRTQWGYIMIEFLKRAREPFGKTRKKRARCVGKKFPFS